MRHTKLAVLALAGALALAACGDDDNGDDTAANDPTETQTQTADPQPADEPNTVVDAAVDSPDLTTLATAVEAAGLVETLQQPGPYTVFAPTNDAFAGLPDGVVEQLLLPCNEPALTTVLTYHVLPAEVPSADIEPGAVATVEGSEVSIGVIEGGVTVNEATVVQADVQTGNGVVHVINDVLLPPSFSPDDLQASC